METVYGVGIANRFAVFNDENIGEAESGIDVPVKTKQVTPKTSKPKQPSAPEIRTGKPEVSPKKSSPKEEPAAEFRTVKPEVKLTVLVKTKAKAPISPTVSVGGGYNTAKNKKQQLVSVASEEESWDVTDRDSDHRKLPAGHGRDDLGEARRKSVSGTRIFYRGGTGITPGRPNHGQYNEVQHGKDKVDGQGKSLEEKDGADSLKSCIADRKESNPEEIKDRDSKENEKQKVNGTNGSQAPKKVAPPQVVTFTLSQWKAAQAPQEKPMFNIRKPGEGEKKLEKLEKLVPIKKEDKLVLPEPDECEMDEVYYPQRAGKQKLLSDVGFTFDAGRERRRLSSRSGGGDGPSSSFGRNVNQQTKPSPRSKGRGRGLPGAIGSGPVQVQVPRIDDNGDFPTLG